MAFAQLPLQSRLARFEFAALFCEDLGWHPVDEHRLGNGFRQDADPSALNMILAAETGQGHGVVMVGGNLEKMNDPRAFHRWLESFTRCWDDPLVVWIHPEGQRSLWCWLGQRQELPYWRSAWVVKGEGNGDFAKRLGFLQRGLLCPKVSLGRYLSLQAMADQGDVAELQVGWQQGWQSLNQALVAIPQQHQRQHYAMVWLCRLVAAATLQHRGYLGGDEWYLQNQFGQSQQQQPDQFFQKVLQPLCQQGFTLPFEDRALTVQQTLGPVPFVPHGPFSPTVLDQRWGHIPIADRAFEPILAWLGDWLMTPDPTRQLLGIAEAFINSWELGNLVTPEPVLHTLCDRTLTATLLERAAALEGQPFSSREALLMTISPTNAARLLEELGQLVLLDPACGSGRFLVAGLQHWAELAQTLRGITRLDGKVAVPQWVQAGSGDREAASQHTGNLAIYRHLLTQGLYGLDLWPPAVELTRLQLFLQAVEQTNQAQELVGLPDLSLTMLTGNGLVGLVQVEAERFEQVSARGRRKVQAIAGDGTVPLQGNLLQPLLADNYQGVLAERQVRLEHYRSQTQLLAESGSVPDYAQADFWRDRIQELNHIAQDKLTHLLWNECSQQLGIRVQYQDASGKRQSRLLEYADVEALAPFHWGFYFHHLLEQRGGFDLILSHFPTGTAQPRETEFVDRYEDMLRQKNMAASTFLHNRKQILTIDDDLNRTWCEYRSTFSLPNQYFRRSSHYPHAAQAFKARPQSRLSWSRLYLERTLQLLRPGGRCGVVLDSFWEQDSSASLRSWLQAHTRLDGILDLGNSGELWPDLPGKAALCLLWLQAGESTQTVPYRAYLRASQALTSSTLGTLLQSLIDLGQ